MVTSQHPNQASPIRLLTSGQLLSVVGQQGILCNQAADGGVFEVASQLTNNTGPVQIVASPAPSYTSLFGTQIMPISSQMIATPVAGPGGTITYNLIPQYQSMQSMTVGQDSQDHTGTDQRSISQTQMIQTSTGLKQGRVQETVSASVGQSGKSIGIGRASSSCASASTSQVSNFGGQFSLANINQSGIITIGGTQQNIIATRPNNNMQPIQQMQTVSLQIPVSTANGQTVLQTIQVPLQSIQTPQAVQGTQGLTMYNLVPQQTLTVTSPAQGTSIQATSTCNNTNPSGSLHDSQSILKLLTIPQQQHQQQQQQQTMSALPTVLNVPTFGSDGSTVPMMMTIDSQMLGSAAGNQGAITVMAMPQSVIQPNVQNTGGSIQNILLPNGQIVQALTASACQNFPSVQIVGQNGQANQSTNLVSLNQLQFQVFL